MNKVHFRVLLNIENMLNTSMWLYIIQHMFKSEVNILWHPLIMLYNLICLIASQMHIEWSKWVKLFSIHLNYVKCNACMHDFEFENLGMLHPPELLLLRNWQDNTRGETILSTFECTQQDTLKES